DQRSGASLRRAAKPERERAAAALRELERAMRALAGGPSKGADASARIHPTALAATTLLDDLPEFFDGLARRAGSVVAVDVGADDRARHDAFARAALIWCLRRPALRDIGLATWLDGPAAGDAALEAQLRWEGGQPYCERIGRRMSGEGPQPDAERLQAALEACREAASVAPKSARAGALSACAWLSWALGRMTHAEVYARHAVGIEPGHGMGGIVLGMVGAGHLPDWAFRRPGTT
ncbi:MAG: lipopolysaccharide biosynthesis protein, partial [Microbacterium sp.]